MKSAQFLLLPAAIVLLASCSKPPVDPTATPKPEMKDGKPVVHVPPVPTRSFEDGYDAGYEYGKKHATPKGKLATEDEAAKTASENAAGQPERWERGFAEGYADGVRNVVTGQK